ncbi:hypothetical protein L6R52_37805, partial [Myxococcota bacterium]|nr:hypothetical protein [Myxococcota bacterium]
ATAPALDRVADPAPSADARFDGGRPFLELSRPVRRAGAAPRLELVEPKPKPRDVALAALGAVLMVICLVAFYFARPPAWQADRGRATVGHDAPVSRGSNGEARGGSLAEGASR